MKALIDGDLILYAACHSVQTGMYIAYNEEGEPMACSPRKKDLTEYDNLEYTYTIDEGSYHDGILIIDRKIDARLRKYLIESPNFSDLIKKYFDFS